MRIVKLSLKDTVLDLVRTSLVREATACLSADQVNSLTGLQPNVMDGRLGYDQFGMKPFRDFAIPGWG